MWSPLEYLVSHLAQSTSIPLVRLNLILPFVKELDRRGCDASAVLARNGLVRETLLDDSVFVPVIVIHRFLEDAALAAADPFLGAQVGEALNWAAWPPSIEAAKESKNLVGFLVRFIRSASQDASSAWHELVVGPEFSVFRERRTTDQGIDPAQNDAFMASVTLSLLRAAAGQVWDAQQVRLTVCDPEALPARYLGTHILGGDRMGVSIRFPSSWLVQPFNRESFLQTTNLGRHGAELPKPFMAALEHVILQHLHESRLSLEQVSNLLDMSPKTLQRRLKAAGTTLSDIIRELKREEAIRQLVQSRRAIGDISYELGFSNPNSFTRAFKTWTGVPPREYRKQHRDF